MATPVVTFDFTTWTKYAPAFENVNPSLGQVYFDIATASIIAVAHHAASRVAGLFGGRDSL
jgi:hypothetical protein